MCDEGGTRLKGTQGSFEWPVDLSAAQIDESIVLGKGLDDLSFQFWWSAPDEPFSVDRSVMAVEAGAETVRFELSDRPEWRGPLRRFRLSWTGTPSSGTWLASVRFQRN
ncbi:MAG: hypothetical protein O7A04_12010 [Acidobacteria bacterium]|nr:hypothetical protein [Acidobacteriota bacterium]